MRYLNYKELTDEQIKAMLVWSKAEYHLLSQLEFYGELKYNPPKKPDPVYLIISHILDLDFEKDILNNPEIKKIHQTIDIRKEFDSDWWFIGDTLINIVQDMANSGNLNEMEFIVEPLKAKIKKTYTDFLNLYENKNYMYIKSDYVINGETLYKRVKKND